MALLKVCYPQHVVERKADFKHLRGGIRYVDEIPVSRPDVQDSSASLRLA